MTQPAASQTAFPVLPAGAAAPDSFRGAVVAIGNFDGVHRGHRAVLDVAIGRAAALGRRAAALTFEPHTRSFFRPQEQLFRLSDEHAKLRLLAATGLDAAIVLGFDAQLADLTAEDFVKQILVDRFAVKGAVVGFDFHFGHARRGSADFLREQGEKHGFEVDVAPPLADGGRPVSSSAIRTLLSEGRVAEAAVLLGHPWFVTAEVLHGEKRGRELGFPTANLRLGPTCGLRQGIYAVRVGLGAARYDGVASFGRRPTFDNGAPLLEVYLFDFSGDLYGQRLDVAFVDWIRPEVRFDSIEALVLQMEDDRTQARDMTAANPGAFPQLAAI